MQVGRHLGQARELGDLAVFVTYPVAVHRGAGARRVRTHGVAQGIHSAFSVPLTLDGATVGAVNLFSATPHAFTESDIARTQAFTAQAATALSILLRHARQTALDEQLQEALATRAVIDQALGMLMVTRKINSREAFEILRHTSQTHEPEGSPTSPLNSSRH